MTAKGMGPAFIQRGEHQEDHQQRKANTTMDCPPSLAFLKRYPTPVDGITFRYRSFISHLLERVKRLARAVARGGASQYECGIETIEVRNGSRC